MAAPEISTLSKEYIKVRVQARVNGADFDPTGDVVAMAFMLGGASPASGDFKDGSWETDATTSPATYWARCLVGPGGVVQLAAGLYTVWVKVSDAPEIPVRICGLLRVV